MGLQDCKDFSIKTGFLYIHVPLLLKYIFCNLFSKNLYMFFLLHMRDTCIRIQLITELITKFLWKKMQLFFQSSWKGVEFREIHTWTHILKQNVFVILQDTYIYIEFLIQCIWKYSLRETAK
jgi:hypothetical protein